MSSRRIRSHAIRTCEGVTFRPVMRRGAKRLHPYNVLGGEAKTDVDDFVVRAHRRRPSDLFRQGLAGRWIVSAVFQ